MKFNLAYARRYDNETLPKAARVRDGVKFDGSILFVSNWEIEINSLEELLAFMKEVGHPLILSERDWWVERPVTVTTVGSSTTAPADPITIHVYNGNIE